MESEPRQPDPELDRHFIAGRTLSYWYGWMCRNPNNEVIANEPVPVERYGNTVGEVAWYALGVACIIKQLNGDPKPEAGQDLADFSMIEAANGNPRIAAFILGNWRAVPEVIQNKIDEVGRLYQ